MDRAVARAFNILETLAQAHGPARLSAVAQRTGLQKSTVHRILGTLTALGYAEQDEPSGLYRASLKAWELGAGVITDLPIKRAAAGFLQEAHRATGETVSLTVLTGDDVLYLDKIISPRPARFTTRIGSRAPATNTAGGKAILAIHPDAEAIIARASARRPLDVEALRAELAEARARGYAISSYSPGVISIGAAVRGPRGLPEAAISVSAPKERVTSAKQTQIIEAVLGAAARMAEAAGAL